MMFDLFRRKSRFSLKHPEGLKAWIRDLLNVDTESPAKPYASSIWTYRALTIWTRLADVRLVLTEESSGRPVESGPELFLIQSPNSKMDTRTFHEWLILSLGLEGDIFLLREDGTNTSGLPRYLDPVWPTRVSTPPGEDVQFGVPSAWILDVGQGKTKRIDPKGMIHYRLPNPYDSVFGLAPLDAALLTVDADYAARKHNRKMMQRHGRIANLISFPEPVADLPALKKAWDEKVKGGDNAGGDVFLDHGAKLQQLSLSMKDLDWLEGQKLSREEILAAFGIPPTMAGILDKATYSNHSIEAEALWTETLIPLGGRLESIWNKLLHESNPKVAVEFAFDQDVPVLQAKVNERVDRYIKLLSQGKVTPARAAEMTGVDLGKPHPAQDVVWIGMGEVPFSVEAAPENQPASPPTNDGAGEGEDESENDAEGKAAPPSPPSTGTNKADLSSLRFELRQARGRTIVQDAVPYERKMLAELKPFFAAQRSAVFSNVDKIRGLLSAKAVSEKRLSKTPAEIADLMLGSENWTQRLKGLMRPIVTAAAIKGANRLFAEVKPRKPMTATEHSVNAYVRAQAVLMGKVQDYTRQALAASAQDLIGGLQEGQSVDEVMDNLKTSLRGVMDNNEVRRQRIARTESLRALNGGRFEGMKEAGVPRKEWLSVRDADVRETHLDFDNGVAYPMDHEFAPGLAWPGDPRADAGETINCRCTLLPSFATETQENT